MTYMIEYHLGMIFLLAFETCLKNFQCCFRVAQCQAPLSSLSSKWLNAQKMKHLVHELVLSKLIPMIQCVFCQTSHHDLVLFSLFRDWTIYKLWCECHSPPTNTIKILDQTSFSWDLESSCELHTQRSSSVASSISVQNTTLPTSFLGWFKMVICSLDN